MPANGSTRFRELDVVHSFNTLPEPSSFPMKVVSDMGFKSYRIVRKFFTSSAASDQQTLHLPDSLLLEHGVSLVYVQHWIALSRTSAKLRNCSNGSLELVERKQKSNITRSVQSITQSMGRDRRHVFASKYSLLKASCPPPHVCGSQQAQPSLAPSALLFRLTRSLPNAACVPAPAAPPVPLVFICVSGMAFAIAVKTS